MVQHFGEDLALMGRVREGMCVLDVAGAEVGKVETVKMGDPAAVTSQGQVSGLDEPFLEVERPEVRGPYAERLLRVGFVKVSRKGLFTGCAYVPGDQIEAVDEDTVRLGVDQEQLIPGA